jgi:hypothetical protein
VVIARSVSEISEGISRKLVEMKTASGILRRRPSREGTRLVEQNATVGRVAVRGGAGQRIQPKHGDSRTQPVTQRRVGCLKMPELMPTG